MRNTKGVPKKALHQEAPIRTDGNSDEWMRWLWAEKGLCVASDRNRKWTGSFWQLGAGFRTDRRFAEWPTPDWQGRCVRSHGRLMGIIPGRTPHNVAWAGTHTDTQEHFQLVFQTFLPPLGAAHVWLTASRCVSVHVCAACTSQCTAINLHQMKVGKLQLKDLSFSWGSNSADSIQWTSRLNTLH